MALRVVAGQDIFISYSRRDGLAYATSLAASLADRDFACHLDVYETEPGAAIPSRLLDALRRSRMLVVVATAGAAASQHVQAEIGQFAGTGGHIVLLGSAEEVEHAAWHEAVAGLPVIAERVIDGVASESAVKLIDNAFRFRKRNQRVQTTFRVLLTLTLTVAAVLTASVFSLRRVTGNLRTEQVRLQSVTERADASNRELKTTNERLHAASAETAQAEASAAAAAATAAVQERRAREQQELAQARREIAEVEARRAAQSWTTAPDLVVALGAARKIERLGSDREAHAALSVNVTRMARLRHSWAHGGRVLALTRDRRWVVTADGFGVVRFWDWVSGTEASPPLHQKHVIDTLAFTDDEHLLVRTRLQGTWLWNLKTRSSRRMSCPTTGQAPRLVKASLRGRYFAVVCGPTIHVNTVDDRTVAELPAGSLVDLTFALDDRYLLIQRALADGRSLALIDLSQPGSPSVREVDAGTPGPRLYSVFAESGLVVTSFSRFDPLISTGRNQVTACRLPDLSGCTTLPHNVDVQPFASPDGTLLATVERGTTIRIWDATQGRLLGTLSTGHGSEELVFSSDSRFLVTRTLRVLDAPSGRMVSVVPAPFKGRRPVAFVRGHGLLVENDAGTMELWDIQPISQLGGMSVPGEIGPRHEVVAGADSPRAAVIFETGREDVRLSLRAWDIATGETVLDRRPPGDSDFRIAFGCRSGDDSILVLETDDDRKVLRVIGGAGGKPFEITGIVDVGCRPSLGWIGLAENGKRLRVLESGETFEWKGGSRFAQGGRLILEADPSQRQADDSPPRVFDVDRRREVTIHERIPGNARVSVTRRGTYLALYRDHAKVVLHDASTGRVLRALLRPSTDAEVSHDGRFLATAHTDGWRVWEVGSGREVAHEPTVDPLNYVMFTFDDRYVLGASRSRLQLWTWRLDDLVDGACDVLARSRSAIGLNQLTGRALAAVCGRGVLVPPPDAKR